MPSDLSPLGLPSEARPKYNGYVGLMETRKPFMTENTVAQELLDHLRRLDSSQQLQVLAFVRSLAAGTPRGVPGGDLLAFAGCLDQAEGEAMRAAIEEGCENVEPDEW
jgi:hypothetical protein